MASLSIFPKLLLVTLVGSFLYACEAKVSTSGGVNVQPSETVKESPVSSSSPNTDKVSPKDAEDYYNRGVDKQKSGDKQGAIADYNEAIRLNPNLAAAYTNRGGAKFESGDKQGAMADFNEAIRLDPNLADAFRIRGDAKDDIGDKKGAIADYNEAIRLDPNLAEAYSNRGAVYANSGEKLKALPDLHEASRLFQQQGKTSDYEVVQKTIKKLGG
ncbi:MAG: tetratricopeptide repeat protein [Pseudanabaena sp. ELA748]